MSTRRFYLSVCFAVIFLARVPEIFAQPAFVNGLVIPGDQLDATRQAGANSGRFGFSPIFTTTCGATSGGPCPTAALAAVCTITPRACSDSP